MTLRFFPNLLTSGAFSLVCDGGNFPRCTYLHLGVRDSNCPVVGGQGQQGPNFKGERILKVIKPHIVSGAD
ncbi:hypothetical protein ASPFODRAFT_51464 [Aspergillus luchuensis CBS 106.47]|uniref:Uncharacterized protein n=1 Tax=Aspergillus luchuensis (strain CBS 106.47) TaxID=1137211 RepID=A0A1M3T4V8_ASPLC|nr:hypothetical protein ASPFODRAFT_51464 [Aspergillus luchuensis CBS 106.47]